MAGAGGARSRSTLTSLTLSFLHFQLIHSPVHLHRLHVIWAMGSPCLRTGITHSYYSLIQEN